MIIGILKEKENRVALLPEGVTALINLKANIIVENSAGNGAFASDDDYKKAGAEIDTQENVLNRAQLLIKINPPKKEDLAKFRPGQTLLAMFNPYFNLELIEELARLNITSFSLEMVPRISRAQTMDVLSAMATVAGYKAVLTAANNLPKFFPMFITAAGTITPAKILILGAGVAGLQAIATARRLGAVVEVFDVRAAAKEEVLSLGGKFIEVAGAMDDKSAGGYAIEQVEEFKQRQAQAIHGRAIQSDVIICTAQIPGRKAPLLLTTATIEAMRPGSIIIDLAASTGGNCELSKNNETVVHHGIKIIGNSSLAEDLPVDASKMLGKNVINFLKLIISPAGELNINWDDDIIKNTCLTHNQQIINEKIRLALKI